MQKSGFEDGAQERTERKAIVPDPHLKAENRRWKAVLIPSPAFTLTPNAPLNLFFY